MIENRSRIRPTAGFFTLFLIAQLAFATQQAGSLFAAGDARLQAGLIAQTIRSIIDKTENPNLKWPRFPYYHDELQALYEPQEYAPLWLAEGRPIKQLQDVVIVLYQASSRGLDPRDYDAELLERQWRELSAGAAYSAHDLALFDTGVSLALMRYISDLHIGKINPRNLDIGLNIEPKKYDLAAVVKAALVYDNIQQTVAEAEPPFAQYRQLKQALTQYRRLAAKAPTGPLPVTATVHPGERYPAMPELRQLLTALGDLPPSSPSSGGDLYQGAIVDAVKRFQVRHGLEPDGLMGKNTFAALNVPMQRRVRQIEMALERVRWLPEVAENEPFIVVNIPAFRLWGFRSVNRHMVPELTMNVVVGKAMDKQQTPVFVENMRYVVFSPYWNIPRSITVDEIVPKTRQNHSYIKANNMEIVRELGPNAEALAVNAANIAKLKSGALRVRQKPGSKNALGPAKFIFPNDHSVYLHGTPQQGLFSRSRRDFSHGCIRLEDPLLMAQFVLNDQSEWTRERIQQAMEAGKPTQVNLTKPMPVLLFYTTVIASHDGTVLFFNDVYGHDGTLERMLLAGYPYPP